MKSPQQWNKWGRVLYFLFPKTIGIIHTQGSDIGYEQGYEKGFEHGFSYGHEFAQTGSSIFHGDKTFYDGSYKEYLEKIRNDGLDELSAKV